MTMVEKDALRQILANQREIMFMLATTGMERENRLAEMVRRTDYVLAQLPPPIFQE